MLAQIDGKWLSTLIPTNKRKTLFFSCKAKKTSHPLMKHNYNLGAYLNGKLNFHFCVYVCVFVISYYERSKIGGFIHQFGLEQKINEPTNIIGDFSSCIDLIFITQPNLVMEPGIHFSLQVNCHHHITFSKVNLKICFILLLIEESKNIFQTCLTLPAPIPDDEKKLS